MNKTELPTPVTDDLFDVACLSHDIATAHIVEQIENYGFVVGRPTIKGVVITLQFAHQNHTCGVVTINRLERLFSAEGKDADGLFLPVTGSWCDIRIYLANLRQAGKNRSSDSQRR